MSKKVKIIIGVVLGVLLVGTGVLVYCLTKGPKYVVTEESLAFKEEYEAYNGKTNENNDKEYLTIDIVEHNPMVYSNYDEIFNILEDGTGIIYLGFPTCPWCRNLVPVLIDSALEAKVEKIYYLNILDDRNILSLDKKGKIKTDREGTPEYTQLLERLYNFLPVYSGLKDETIKRIYLPTVVFVKDGKVLGVEQSLSAYSKRVEGDAYKPMNTEEKAELAKIFTGYYNKINKK